MAAVTVARLEAILGADTDQFDRAMDKSEGRMSKMGKAAALGGLAIAGGLAVGLKKSVDAAVESEKAQARLNQALDAAGVSHDKYGASIEANIQKTSKLAALDDEDLSDSFAKLVRSTGDVTKATEGMNLAADIARSRNISLEAATKAVERSLIGNGAAFGKLGVQVVKSSEHLAAAKTEIDSWRDSSGKLTEAEETKAKALMDTARTLDKQATAAKAFDEAQRKFAGGAKEYGETAAGAQERFGVAVENLQEKIGSKLLPVLAKLMEMALKVIESIERNWPKIMEVIGPVMEDVREVIQEVTADIQAIWDKHGKEIMATIKFVFEYVQRSVENGLRIIQGVIDVVLGILTGDWQRAWDGIKNIVGGAFAQIENILRTALTVLGLAAKAIGEAIFNGIKNAVTGIAGAVWNLINNIGEKIADMASTILGWGTSVGSAVKKATIDAIVGIGTGAWGVINNVGETIANMAETIVGWGTSIGSAIKDAVPKALVGIGNAAWDVINNIGSVLSDVVNTITGWGRGIANAIKNGIVDALKGIGNFIWNSIKDELQDLKDRVTGFFGGLWGKITGSGGTGPFAAGDWIPPGNIGPTAPTMGAGGGGGNFPSLDPNLQDEAAMAASSFAYQIQSYNPASRLPSGAPSDHAVYPAKAFDAMFTPATGWNHPGARAFFSAMMGRTGIHYAILGDKIWSAEQGLHGYGYGGHENHVHVSGYDQGGILRPGWTLAYNGTGRNEYVTKGGGDTHFHFPNYLGSRQELMSALRDATAQFERRNGRSAF